MVTRKAAKNESFIFVLFSVLVRSGEARGWGFLV